jgi:hypothetical protein
MPAPRYRCTACGNLTRFDVTATRTTRSFHHYTVGGELQVEETDVLAESIDDVRCRWCGTGESVVEVFDADADADAARQPGARGVAAADAPPSE